VGGPGLIAILFFLLGGGFAFLIRGGVPQGPPNLVVEQETLDYGYVRFDSRVTATFTLRNTGGKPLHILGTQVAVRQGC
jgi:hypothetical protein